MAGRLTKMVLPGIAMRIKMQQRQLSMLCPGSAQQRQRHRMIAAQKDAMVPGHQHRSLRLDLLTHGRQRRGIGQTHIECIAQIVDG